MVCLLTTIITTAFAQGCSDDTSPSSASGGKSGSTGAGGRGGSSGSTSTSSTAGNAGSTSTVGGAGGTSFGSDGASGNGGSFGGSAGADAAGGTGGLDGAAGDGGEPMDAGSTRPDGSQGVSYKFDVSGDLQGWHYAPYGSTSTSPAPTNPPTDPNNLANKSAPLAWDFDDANGSIDASGSLKATVPFAANGDRIDVQAFSTGNDVRDWTGYVVTAKVKLVSGGNVSPVCPLQAWLYISTSPSYATTLSPVVDLSAGNWVTVTYDLALSNLNLSQINQMGIQITTGTCTGPLPEAGSDGAPTSDVTSASDGPTDVTIGDDSAGEDASSEAAVADAGANPSDGSDGASTSPPTATTAVILIDDAIVSVK